MALNKQKDLRKIYGPRKNEFIRVDEVQLIDEKGENLGVVKTYKAMELAKAAGLDLVEVGANVKPPVCKIMDYSKYLYIQNKKSRMNKKGKVKETKEFRFTPVIEQADIEHRIKRAKEYLGKGHPVKIYMFIKGRQSREQAIEVFNQILTNFTDYSSIEGAPVTERNILFLTFKSNGKTENKQDSKKED